MDFYELSAVAMDGSIINFSQFRGKTVLVVNTATKCGLAPQFKELEDLWKTYGPKKFVILGFPCDQFMGQELGNNQEIEEVCQIRFGVTFPLSQKIDVNGDDTHSVFVWLKNQAPGVFGTKRIKWNFTKFLISADGNEVKRIAPKTSPLKLKARIEALIKE
jgi:glutathione peroxidase